MLTWTRLLSTTFLTVLFTSILAAQTPVNDDCGGIIDLGTAPYCPDVTLPGGEADIYDNIDATASDVGFGNIPTCFNGGVTLRDVWFSFVASDTIFDYTITVMGLEGPNGEPSIVNPQIALYRGSCEVNGLAEILCASADAGETMVELTADGLTPGITYFIRVNDYSSSATPNSGAFKLCVDKKDPINLISEGGSTDCEGVLYDSGGPDGDYENNENSVFTICPNQPNQCIYFTLDYYDIEYFADTGGPFPFPAVTDQLLFYDGPDTSPSNLISTLGGTSPLDGNSITANSGVCFEVVASSGCLTIQFVSDGTSTFQGFQGSWECSTTACEVPSPITVDTDVTNEELESVVTSGQSQVTITNIDCDEEAYGIFFAGDNSELGLESGIILSSGRAANAIGPNNEQGSFFDGDFLRPGDPDLDALSALTGDGILSNDACIIELDVFANTNELSFEYVFGSEEYPEYVNQTFNDIFAFLISGPGITGIPELNNQENIAVIPNTNTFVEINSVNNLLNWEYYRNNEYSMSLEYDGLTSDSLGVKKSLTARRVVEPCNTYHLKLAIADRSDFVFDSGVFISEIEGGSPEIDIIYNSGIDYLIEDCTDQPDEVVISLNNTSNSDQIFTVELGGTAIQNVDYLLDIPNTLSLPPGENLVSFTITPLSDLDDMEGTETIIISLSSDFGCGSVQLGEVTILLEDEFNVDIDVPQDTIPACSGNELALEATGAATYFWSPVSIIDDPTSPTPTVTTTESGWVVVEGQIGLQCIALDSVYLEVFDPALAIAADSLNICLGDSIRLSAVHNGFNDQVTWTPATGLSTTSGGMVTAMPTTNTLYTATITAFEGCSASDQVFIDVADFSAPAVIPDTTICQNFGVTLANLVNPNISETIYSWTPDTGLDDASSPTPLAFPDIETTYQLISTADNGACADTAAVTVTVLPADVDILGPDTLLICQDEEINLIAETSTGNGNNLVWSSADASINAVNTTMINATPLQGTTIFATFTIGECIVSDSVYVAVDSLPLNTAIVADPMEDSYCQGELVILSSDIYEPAAFPEIEHAWVSIGAETSDTLYNLVLLTTDTFTYQRITVNGGCTVVDSITLNVITNEGLTITPPQSEICPGESVELSIAAQDLAELTWTPDTGLSCGDCPNPTASPTETTTYTVESSIEGCAIQQSVTITVLSPEGFTPIGAQTICADEVPIALNPAGEGSSLDFTWEGTDGFTSTEPNPIVSPTSTTTYTGTATSICGTNTSTFTITVIENGSIVDIANGADTVRVCRGEVFELSAEIISSNAPSETLAWIYDGEGAVGTTASFTAGNSGLATFNYQFGETQTDNCQELSASVYIQVDDAPSIDLIEDQTSCGTDPVSFILNNNSGEPGVSYSWTSTGSFTSMEPDPEVTATETTTYYLTASLNDCTVTDSVTISLIPPATLEVGPDQIAQPDANGDLEPVELSATVMPAQAEEALVWTFLSPTGTQIGTGSLIEWVPTPADSLPAFAFITVDTGCEILIDSVLIQQLDYRMPDIFSPNGDGTNDIFKPFFLGQMDVVEVRVYNRWGVLVFESNDMNNPGWDGMYKGNPAPADVYIWEVRVGLGDQVKPETGQVTLIR